MHLTNEDIEMIDGSLTILKNMYFRLRELSVTDAKRDISEMEDSIKAKYARKDGKDTRFFDIVAENAISYGADSFGHETLFQKIYDIQGVVITEERGKVPPRSRIEDNTPVIISDPVDRSAYLDDIIKRHGEKCKNMGEVFDCERQKISDAHSRVESCNSSITLLKDNMIKYSAMLNLFTGEIFLAYEPGIFHANIEEIVQATDFKDRADFKTDETLKMLCYTKPGKYENNRMGTHLRFFDLDESINSPGGPNRFTYLLKETGEDKVSRIGVIAHNGEKIQESLPNIAVAYFSKKELLAYKLFCDREYHEHRAGKELTPNLQNSIYNDGLLINRGLKLKFLNNHDYPSEFRDTTVIFPKENEAALTMMEGMVKREFALRII